MIGMIPFMLSLSKYVPLFFRSLLDYSVMLFLLKQEECHGG